MKWSRVFLAVLLIAVMWPQAADAQAKPAPAAAAPEDDPDLEGLGHDADLVHRTAQAFGPALRTR